MSGYLLDTNVASHIVRGDRPEITRRLVAIPVNDIAISAVTEGELLYGLSRRTLLDGADHRAVQRQSR